MTWEYSDSAPATRDAFETALCDLLRTAHTNGVDVRGAVDVCHRGTNPDWTIEITRVVGPVGQ